MNFHALLLFLAVMVAPTLAKRNKDCCFTHHLGYQWWSVMWHEDKDAFSCALGSNYPANSTCKVERLWTKDGGLQAVVRLKFGGDKDNFPFTFSFGADRTSCKMLKSVPLGWQGWGANIFNGYKFEDAQEMKFCQGNILPTSAM